jgi:hypothetical protein
VGKSKASDYFVAGIILIVLAGGIWLLETFVLNGTVDNVILLIIPSVFIMLSLAHLVVAGTNWFSSR